MPTEVPRTWILTLRDRALSIRLQHKGITALGGVQTLIEMDTCHCMMISEPERLAEILVERCRLSNSADDRCGLVQALLPLGVRIRVRGDAATDAEDGAAVSVELHRPDRHVQLGSCDR